jgi:transcriptional antiterminator NusG
MHPRRKRKSNRRDGEWIADCGWWIADFKTSFNPQSTIRNPKLRVSAMADNTSAPTTDQHSSIPPGSHTGAESEHAPSEPHAADQHLTSAAEPASEAHESDTPALVEARSEAKTPPPLAKEAPKHEDEPDQPPSRSAPTEPAAEAPPKENSKRWYVVKVQSGREDTIKEAIERRVRKEGLEEYYGQIVIPVEKVTEVKTDKNGKRVTRTKERKLYPGYLMCEVEYNDRILYLFRETSGVGDFVGAQPGNLDRPPTPMSDREVQKILGPQGAEKEAPTPARPKGMDVGDRVRVVDGIFNGMEGTVKQILESVGRVQVEVTIFGRPTAVDLEYYQVELA